MHANFGDAKTGSFSKKKEAQIHIFVLVYCMHYIWFIIAEHYRDTCEKFNKNGNKVSVYSFVLT